MVKKISESVLQEADRLINGDRPQCYGPPKKNFKDVADLWSGWLGIGIGELDVAVLMVLMKVARLKNGYHRDSVVDIGGYAGTMEKLGLELEK